MSAKAEEIFEKKPRWPGAPKICIYENMLAFETEKELNAFNDTCASPQIVEKWICKACGCYHYVAKPTPPAGASSGTGREFKYNPPRYRRFAVAR